MMLNWSSTVYMKNVDYGMPAWYWMVLFFTVAVNAVAWSVVGIIEVVQYFLGYVL